MAKESREDRKARFLAMVDQGGEEFRGANRTPIAPPAPDLTAVTTLDLPPEEPESYHFTEPQPSRRSLDKLGFKDFGSKMPPELHRAGKRLAEELGIDFAVLLTISLGLVVDPDVRNNETQALLDRLRARFSN